MSKNSALLSIGAALLFSLFFVDISHAFKTDRKKDASIVMAGEMNGTANLSSTQVSTTPNPCTVGGKGRTGAPGKKLCPSGSGEKAIAGSQYASQVSTTPNSCTEGGKGRTGAPCTKQNLSGSGKQATDARIVMPSVFTKPEGLMISLYGTPAGLRGATATEEESPVAERLGEVETGGASPEMTGDNN